MVRNIYTYLSFLVIITSVTSQKCPSGCYCTGIFATCSGFITFPETFETSAEIVSIHRSSFPVIPGNALRGAPNLTEVYIYESVIGKIENCAFKGFENLISLAIYNSDIGTISSGAFSNITFSDKGSTRFSIYQVNIDIIEPYAFTSISNAKVFNIYQANITTIGPHAFNDLTDMPFFSIYLSNISDMQSSAFYSFTNIGYVSVYSSYIENLDCGTFDRFTVELGNSFSFYELEVHCDCNVAMLLLAAKRNPAISIGRTRCRGPAVVAGRPLSDLSVPAICRIRTRTRNCPVPKPAVPGQCSSPGNGDRRRPEIIRGNTRVRISGRNESEPNLRVLGGTNDTSVGRNIVNANDSTIVTNSSISGNIDSGGQIEGAEGNVTANISRNDNVTDTLNATNAISRGLNETLVSLFGVNGTEGGNQTFNSSRGIDIDQGVVSGNGTVDDVGPRNSTNVTDVVTVVTQGNNESNVDNATAGFNASAEIRPDNETDAGNNLTDSVLDGRAGIENITTVDRIDNSTDDTIQTTTIANIFQIPERFTIPSTTSRNIIGGNTTANIASTPSMNVTDDTAPAEAIVDAGDIQNETADGISDDVVTATDDNKRLSNTWISGKINNASIEGTLDLDLHRNGSVAFVAIISRRFDVMSLIIAIINFFFK